MGPIIKIFISYRREDAADVTGRVNDRLREKFGDAAIFTDVDSIPIGVDFREHLAKAVGQCDVLLAVIGRKWIDIEDSNGQRRLDHPTDFVRTEIELALDREIPVVPLLAHDITMPTDDKLPQSIKPLAFRNATTIRPDPDFHKDMDRLIAGLEKIRARPVVTNKPEVAAKSVKPQPQPNDSSPENSNSRSNRKANNKSLWRYVFGAILVGLLLAGGWFLIDSKQQKSAQLNNGLIMATTAEKNRAAEETIKAKKEAERKADAEKLRAQAEEKRRVEKVAAEKREAEAEEARRQAEALAAEKRKEAMRKAEVKAAASAAKLKTLLSQINSNIKSQRLSATQSLKDNYADSSKAVEMVLAMLTPSYISNVSLQGRVNTLFFLANTKPAAWPKELKNTGQETVIFLKSLGLGPDASGELEKVSNLLKRL